MEVHLFISNRSICQCSRAASLRFTVFTPTAALFKKIKKIKILSAISATQQPLLKFHVAGPRSTKLSRAAKLYRPFIVIKYFLLCWWYYVRGFVQLFELLDMVDYTLKDRCETVNAVLLLNCSYKSWKSEPKMTKTVQIVMELHTVTVVKPRFEIMSFAQVQDIFKLQTALNILLHAAVFSFCSVLCIQFSYIYTEASHNNSHLKVLCIKDTTNIQTTPNEQVLWWQ